MLRIIDRLVLAGVYRHATRAYERFVQDARQATAVQERVLLEKVALNADSDFGREHHFERIKSYGDFIANVPISRYEQIRPYVDRARGSAC